MAISKITENGLTITDLTVADDLTVTDDLLLASDGAVIKFGADSEVTLTHVADAGLEINTKFDMNGQELILDADADTSITADTDDRIDFRTAGSDVMHIDSSGRVLIGTTDNGFATTDMDDLVIGNTTGNHGLAIVSNSSNGYSSIAFSDANSGNGRIAGYIDYGHSANEMTFGGGGAGDTRMKIRAGGVATFGTNDFIKTDGFLKVSNVFAFHGSTDNYSNVDGQQFHELNSGQGNEFILMMKNTNTGTTQQGLYFDHTSDTNNTNSHFIQAYGGSSLKFEVHGNGNVTSATNSYGSTSDERLKSDIVDANSQWEDIKAVKIRNFKKFNNTYSQIGVIAQELETVSPKLIEELTPEKDEIKHNSEFGTLYTSDDAETKPILYEKGDDIPDEKEIGDVKTPASKVVGEVKERKEMVKGVKYSILYMKAIKALQEAMTRIETLEAKVKTLEEA